MILSSMEIIYDLKQNLTETQLYNAYDRISLFGEVKKSIKRKVHIYYNLIKQLWFSCVDFKLSKSFVFYARLLY